MPKRRGATPRRQARPRRRAAPRGRTLPSLAQGILYLLYALIKPEKF